MSTLWYSPSMGRLQISMMQEEESVRSCPFVCSSMHKLPANRSTYKYSWS
jgi:hypothetical protein